MKTALLIIVLLLGGFSSLYSRFKRTLAEDGNPSDGTETQSFGSAETDDDLFSFGEAETDDELFSFGDAEAEEANITQQEGYFTYETPEAGAKVEPVENVKQTESVQVQTDRPAFDLRQAVVYQTLLCNPYITQ